MATNYCIILFQEQGFLTVKVKASTLASNVRNVINSLRGQKLIH